jgi:hypothetical protein
VLHPDLVALQDKAEAFAKACGGTGFATATGRTQMMLAIARPSRPAFILAIDHGEWDAIAIANLLGFPNAPKPKPQIEHAAQRRPTKRKR